jgi:hypothetical protein
MASTIDIGTGGSYNTNGTADKMVFQPGSDNTDFAQFRDSAGSPILNIDSSNTRLGVGTSSPGALVHARRSANEILRLETASGTGSPFLSFFQNGTRRSLIQHADSGDTLRLSSEYGQIELRTGTGGTEQTRMTVTSGGNVGIPNAPASARLEVEGQSDSDAVSIVDDGSNQMFAVRDDVDAGSNDATHILSNGGRIVVVPQGTTGAAIQEAINNVSGANGGIVYLPAGTYVVGSISDCVSIPANVQVVGAGIGATIISATGTGSNYDVFTTMGTLTAIRNMTFQSTSQRHTAIKCLQAQCDIANVRVTGFNIGIFYTKWFHNTINPEITFCNTGMLVGNAVTTGTVSVTQGSPIVNGTVDWLNPGDNRVVAGSAFRVDSDGVQYTIASVDSATQLTLTADYAGTTSGSEAYKILQEANSNVFVNGTVQHCEEYGIRCLVGWGNSFYGISSELHETSNAKAVSLENASWFAYPGSQTLSGCFIENSHTSLLRIDSKGNKILGCWFSRNHGVSGQDGDFITWASGNGPSDGNIISATTFNDQGGTGVEFADTHLTKVGIGTTSPAAPLEVVGRSRIQGSGTLGGGLWLTDSDAPTTSKSFIGRGSDSEDMVGIYTASGWRLTIPDSTGRVGIGQTSPATGLHIGKNAGGSNKGIITLEQLTSEPDAPGLGYAIIYMRAGHLCAKVGNSGENELA